MKINRAIAQRSKRLLNMEYKVSEICAELQVTDKTVYTSWLIGGIPHRKDAGGHLWIVGTAAAEWLSKHTDTTRHIKRHPMKANEAYCMVCRKAVDMAKITRREKYRSCIRIYAVGACGHKVLRMAKSDTPKGKG